MSFASARTPLTSPTSTFLTSADVGSVIQLGANDGVLPAILVSGVLTPLTNINFPIGLFTGFAEVSVVGDATTVLEYLNIIEDNEGGASNFLGAYLVGTTLPSDGTFVLKYPISRYNENNSGNEIVLSVQAEFTGTAPRIIAVYVQLLKVV
jgi:hypothetical protein